MSVFYSIPLSLSTNLSIAVSLYIKMVSHLTRM